MSVLASNPERRKLADGLAPLPLGRYRVLHVEGEVLYASRGLDLYRSFDAGRSFEKLASAPGRPRFPNPGHDALVRPLPAQRLPRRGAARRRRPLAIVRGAVLHLAPGDSRFTVAHHVTLGTRPLNLCVSSSGRAFFGEYHPNRAREQTHVFASDDGRRWEVAHTFPAGSIRHVHGIHRDDHRGGLWVLTGDEGDESGIWWTDDEFQTLEPVVRGVQRVRAVTLLCLPEGLVLPMDTPSERNFVQHLDPSTGALTPLAELPGSVLFSARTPSLWLLSTAVEKSLVNRDDRPALFASRDGFEWAGARPLPPRPALPGRPPRLPAVPDLVLPSGSSTLNHVLASGQAIAGAHGQLLSWSEDDLLAALEPAPLRQTA